jgi:signal transduction histidine kinase
MLELIILILSVLVNSLLGLTVLIKNPKRDMNKLFFLLTLSLSIWLAVTYLSVNPPPIFSQLVWVRLVLGAASLLCFFVLASFAVFPEGKFSKLRFIRPILIYLGGVLVLTQTPLVFSSLEYNSDGTVQPVVAPGIVFFMFLAVSYLSAAIYLLVKKLKHSYGQTRSQLRIVVFGVATSFTGILISNLFLVSIFKDTSLISFAPLLTLILTGSMAYAIARHRLFDIKRTVARSVAYLLSLGFVGLIYGAILFGVSSLLSGYESFDSWERVFYIILALITAVSFSPTKKFFDRLTNRIFYRDAYDPQQFLDDLNSTVVENIELGILLRHTTNVIQENIKSQFCYVEVETTTEAKERLVGTGEFEMPKSASKTMKEELIKTERKTVVTDDLGPEFGKLKEVLSRNNIGLVIRMLPGNDMSQETLYYLIVGDKKSGNIYDEQDIRLMEIIADELLIAIQNSLRFEEIQQFNVTLQQKVNDATEKLQRTNKKLREMDETKDEFISMASHQLRTPLTSVKGYLSMVLDGDAGKLKGNQKELLDQAFVSSQRMVYLIADLLNVSRLKTGKFLIDPSPTNLAKVIESEISQLKEVAKGKKVTLTYDKPANFPQLMLDETKIRQVIMNFVDNAIYYTLAGGKVRVELKEDKSNVYFAVKDDGIGIPQSEQSQLFTKFYRASNARKARPDGTGLGLFMAKKVVNSQGGEVLFESKEGKGSTFGFTFKKAKLEPESKQESSSATVTS